jgi:hypothetical protein
LPQIKIPLYDPSLDYTAELTPPLSDADRTWLPENLHDARE